MIKEGDIGPDSKLEARRKELSKSVFKLLRQFMDNNPGTSVAIHSTFISDGDDDLKPLYPERNQIPLSISIDIVNFKPSP